MEVLVKERTDLSGLPFAMGDACRLKQERAREFGDALARFGTFARDFPVSSLAAEAALRQGFCQVQLKMWADAQKTLQPLMNREGNGLSAVVRPEFGEN